MKLIIKNMVTVVGVLVLMTACGANVPNTDSSQDDRNYIIEDVVSPGDDLGQEDQESVTDTLKEVVSDDQVPEVMTLNASGEVKIKEDQSVIIQDLLANNALGILKVDNGNFGGVVTLLDDGSVKYRPLLNFYGVEFFKYYYKDDRGQLLVGVVIVDVEAVDDIPVANSDSVVLNENEEAIFNLLSNDLGVGDGVQFSIVSAPSNGNVAVGDDGIASYLPNSDYFGVDEFVYQITDGDGDVSIATVSLQIDCLANCSRTFKLSWDASVSADVAAYKVYVGTKADALDEVIEVGNVLQFSHLVAQRGEYFFAVSAVNSSAIESELSTVQSAVF